jgi:hypothetical protein
MLPALAEDAPYAIGGTLSSDPYTLANAAAELSLREAGWLAESYGCGNPGSTLAAAIREQRPQLLWLSVSTFSSVDEFCDEFAIVSEAAATQGVPLAVGGRALAPEIRRRMTYSAYCDSLRCLVSFAQASRSRS